LQGHIKGDNRWVLHWNTGYYKTIPKMKLLLLSFRTFTDWIEGHLLSCPSKTYLHIECPGCGFQRSCLALLKGNIPASLTLYPATIPIVLLIFFTLFHLKYKFAHGAAIIKYLQAGIAIVIAVFYIYKIVNHKIIA
jgi:hypothetical protein